MAGVEVTAYCGMGTLRATGMATSGADGRYELNFGPGFLMPRGDGTVLQAATITAHRPGYFEANLCRQGGCHAAEKMPDDDTIKDWGGRKDRVFLPDQPLEINFVMRPAGRVSGKLVDEQGKPLAGYSVGLGGPDSPPSSSAVGSTEADAKGASHWKTSRRPIVFNSGSASRIPSTPGTTPGPAPRCDSSGPMETTCAPSSAIARSASGSSSSASRGRACTVAPRDRSLVTRVCST